MLSMIEAATVKTAPIRIPRSRNAAKLLSGDEMRALWRAFQQRDREWRQSWKDEARAKREVAKLYPAYPKEATVTVWNQRNGAPVPNGRGGFRKVKKKLTAFDLREKLKRPLSADEKAHAEKQLAAVEKWERKRAAVEKEFGLPALERAWAAAEAAQESAFDAIVDAKTASAEGVLYKLRLLADFQTLKDVQESCPGDISARLVLDSIQALGTVVGISTSRETARH
jgi:hypothetical protein